MKTLITNQLHNFMRKNHFSLFLSFILLFAFPPRQANAQATALQVIPEVQHFTASGSSLSLGKSLKIRADISKNDSLLKVAEQLKEELNTMFSIKAKVVTVKGSESYSKNDILLTYSTSTLENFEAYDMQIGVEKGIVIAGASRTGTFWGTRTLLQLVENHQNSIPTGQISDYPNFPNRGFMIDAGRKFFSIDFLRNYVKILAYYKMNELHVHLNDNGFKQHYNNDWSKTYAAFRLESETYPGLAAKDGHYTKAEFRDLVLLGMENGVNVIPEIDIPAHSLAFTRYNPELQASAPYAEDHLDILNDKKVLTIYHFFDRLFDEYIVGENPVFAGPDVHIGTDEYVKEGQIRDVDDAQARRFREFTIYYLNYIARSGKNPRLWGGLKWLKDNPVTTVRPPNKNTVMNSWSVDWVDAEEMLKKGFNIINTLDQQLYIVPAAGYYRDFLDVETLYKVFRPENVSPWQTLPENTPGLLGSTFAVWNDVCENGISQQDVHHRVIPAVKVMSTKNWNPKPARSFEDYSRLAQQSIDAPGVNLSGMYKDEDLQNITARLGKKAVKLNGRKAINLGGSDVGYNYEISFMINPAVSAKKDAILFQSEQSRITLNTNGSGKLGFYRDGVTYTFNFEPTIGQWQKITLSGDYKSVALAVNDEQVERLTAYRKTEGLPNGINFQQTLFFPLQKLGDKRNGFVGSVKELEVKIIDPEAAKKEFLQTKTELKPGKYFIKSGDLYLSNRAEKGEAPRFEAKATKDEDYLFQIEKVAETDRYRIISATDSDKYINEIAMFGKNPYSPLWNTYLLYEKAGQFAIQNGGNGGRGFWQVSGNRIQAGAENYSEESYCFEIVAVE